MVAAVNDIVDLLQSVLRPALHAKISSGARHSLAVYSFRPSKLAVRSLSIRAKFVMRTAAFGIGQQIQASIIFGSFVASLETVKKARSFIKIIEGYVLSGFKNIQKL